MQERYLGDIHDFGKFILLSALMEDDAHPCRLGINWYLTDPRKVDHASNNDGNLRYHQAGGKEFESINRNMILEHLRHFSEPENRKIKNLEAMDFWPEGTKFFSEELPATSARSEWFSRALEYLSECNLVFLDPDTGLETLSSKRSLRRSPKYVLEAEIRKHLERKQNVLFIQFIQRQTIDRAVTKILMNLNLPDQIEAVVISYRVAPSVLFFLLMHKPQAEIFVPKLRRFIAGMRNKSINRFFLWEGTATK